MTAAEEGEDLAGATQKLEEKAEDATVPDTVCEPRVETQFFDIAAGDDVSEIDCESPTASLDAEEYRQASRCLAGHVDFLGAAACSKLIPASSTVRRSKRNTLGANSGSRQGKQPSQKRHPSLQTTLLERHGGDHRVSVQHLHIGEKSLSGCSCSSENTCSTSGSECDVTQNSACDGGRRRRASILRERGRERQRGSMKAVAERLGELMKTRGLEVVPEEVEEQLGLAMRQDEHQKRDVENHGSQDWRLANTDTVQLMQVTQEFEHELRGEKTLMQPHPNYEDVATVKKEEELKANSQRNEERHTQTTQNDQVQKTQKRFTLPLRSSRRRRPSDGSLFSACSTITDSEDSMSSAGLSESSGSSSQTLSSISRRYGQTSTTALDALFEKARHAAILRPAGSSSSCHASSTATESSRASSPGALPFAALPASSRKPGSAYVSRSEDLTAVVRAGGHQLQARGDGQLVPQKTGSASLQAAHAFNLCFPGDLCLTSDKDLGKPSEKKVGNETHASRDPAVSPSWACAARRSKGSSADAVSTVSESPKQLGAALISNAS